MPPKYTPRTGNVFIRNFDEGVVKRLGSYEATFDQQGYGPRYGYWLDVPTCTPIQVPVIFNQPEQIFEKKIYPSILITRDPPDLAMQRWHSVKQLEYFAGVLGTETTAIVGATTVSGFGQVEVKQQAMPYDITYTVAAYARYEHEAIPLLQAILRKFTPYAKIPVVDSLGDTRWYTTVNEGGVQDLSEIADIADRVKAYAQLVRVEAELDLLDPVTHSTVGSIESTIGVSGTF